MKMLRYQADRLWKRGARKIMDADELVSAAVMALMKSRKRWQPSKGAWITFATPRAIGAMKDALRELDHVPRLARAHAKRAGTEDQLRQLLSIDTSPTDLVLRDLSGKILPPGELASRNDLWEQLHRLLPSRWAEIVERYFRRGKTLREIGAELGFSESLACQILSRALGRLRRQMKELRIP